MAPAPQRAAKSSASSPSRPAAERERETGREAVPGPVRVGRLGRERSGLVRAAGLSPAAERARRRHDEPGLGIELPGLVPLGLVLPARHERVELHRPLPERRELARGGDEHTSASRQEECVGVSRAEVDGVAARELVPRKRLVVAARMELAADRDDRPLATVVDEDEAAPLRCIDGARVNGDAAGLELLARDPPVSVVAEHGEEVDGVGKLRRAGRRRPTLRPRPAPTTPRRGRSRPRAERPRPGRTPATRCGRRQRLSRRHSHKSARASV